jgi:hypothetical protein
MDRDLKDFRSKMEGDLQEIRGKMDTDLREIRDKIDHNYHKHQKRLNGLQLAVQGDNFLDCCAVAKLDERISALEKRNSRPRKPK